MTTDTKINGRVKFYNKEKGFGFITTEDKKEFYFNSSDLSEHYIPRMGDLISFAPNEENLKKSQKPRATFICPRAKSQGKQSNEHLPPPCPHCGSRKGSKYGWTDDEGCKHNVCLSCGEEHTFGAIENRNKNLLNEHNRAIKFLPLVLFVFILYLLFLILQHNHIFHTFF